MSKPGAGILTFVGVVGVVGGLATGSQVVAATVQGPPRLVNI